MITAVIMKKTDGDICSVLNQQTIYRYKLMRNIIAYVQENLKTFDEAAFTAVDSLVLSTLSYFYLPRNVEADQRICRFRSGEKGLPLKELYRLELFSGMFDKSVIKEDGKKLFAAMCASPRFRNVAVHDYTDIFDKEIQAQFAAITFDLTPEQIYVAFRGTDITLNGWKENINMGRIEPVTSQLAASVYLTKIAGGFDGKICVGGHSKGGNLAVYAAANLTDDLFQKIECIFDHDGPGFTANCLEDPGFQRVVSITQKTVPEFSVIGRIFGHLVTPRVIKSDASGIMQHHPLSWVVENGDFVDCATPSSAAKLLSEGFNSAAGNMTEDERENFTNALFSLINEDVEDTDDLSANLLGTGADFFRNYRKMDGAAKEVFKDTLKKIAGGSFRSLSEKLFP